MNDLVEKPEHYVADRVIEITDLIEDWGVGWHLGNVLKYVSRAGRKGPVIDDLKKARWYLTRKIIHLQSTGDDDGRPADRAVVDAATVIADWRLQSHLAAVVDCMYARRTLDVHMLVEAIGFLDQRIAVIEDVGDE